MEDTHTFVDPQPHQGWLAGEVLGAHHQHALQSFNPSSVGQKMAQLSTWLAMPTVATPVQPIHRLPFPAADFMISNVQHVGPGNR